MITQEAKEKYIDGIIMMARNVGMSPSDFYAICSSMCASINLTIIEDMDVLWSDLEAKKR